MSAKILLRSMADVLELRESACISLLLRCATWSSIRARRGEKTMVTPLDIRAGSW